MKTVLFLGAGPAMPDTAKAYVQKFEVLSNYFTGHIITPARGAPNFKIKNLGRFSFDPYPYYRGNALIRNAYMIFMTVFKTMKLRFFQKRKIDVITTHAPLMIGLITLFLGKLLRAKTVIEINGDFNEAFKFGRLGNIKLSFGERLKQTIAVGMTKFCITHCSMIKSLYPGQLDSLGLDPGRMPPVSCFSDYVPISNFVNHAKKDDNYILLIGFPWYLKGVDLMINAFKNISADFPNYSLKIFGWNPVGTEYFEKLAEGNDKISLNQALTYEEVIEKMTACSLYVLASRTEGVARILLEAMASRKPILAANVGGTSSIIKDGYNGLLFEKENTNELTEKLRRLLSDAELRNRLAENGFTYVQEKLSEDVYSRSYCAMIEKLDSSPA